MGEPATQIRHASPSRETRCTPLFAAARAPERWCSHGRGGSHSRIAAATSEVGTPIRSVATEARSRPSMPSAVRKTRMSARTVVKEKSISA